MAGVKVLVPLLAALLLLVVASTTSAAWKSHDESCQKVNLRPCEKHVMKRIERDDDEDDNVLKMRGVKNYVRRSGRESEEEDDDQRRECCNQLKELDSSECQCRAMQKIMEKKSEQLKDKEMEDMERELTILPMTCGLGGPLFGCKLRSQD